MGVLDPIYNEQFQTELLEQIVQKIDVINGMSNNTIIMNSEDFMGDYKQSTFFGRFSKLIERRDITSDASDSDKRMNKKENLADVIDFKTNVFVTD